MSAFLQKRCHVHTQVMCGIAVQLCTSMELSYNVCFSILDNHLKARSNLKGGWTPFWQTDKKLFQLFACHLLLMELCYY